MTGWSGRRNTPHTKDTFFTRAVTGPSGCLEWAGYRCHLGYGVVGQSGRLKKAHRVAWEFMHGPIPKGLSVLHHCDNRACIKPDHLFLGTQLDNMRDARTKGRLVAPSLRGETNGVSRLTDAAVRSMRADHAARGLSFSRLARDYGVSTMTAWRAVRGHAWSHL